MPKANDLEGPQDQGGKHGGQAGMPKHTPTAADQGIMRDERGQQPKDKEWAQQVSRKDKGGDPPGSSNVQPDKKEHARSK